MTIKTMSLPLMTHAGAAAKWLALIAFGWLVLCGLYAWLGYGDAIAHGRLSGWWLPLLLDGLARDVLLLGAIATLFAVPWTGGRLLSAAIVAVVVAVEVAQIFAVHESGGFIRGDELRHVEQLDTVLSSTLWVTGIGLVVAAAAAAFYLPKRLGVTRLPWLVRLAMIAALVLGSRAMRDPTAIRAERDAAIGTVGLISGSPARAMVDGFVEALGVAADVEVVAPSPASIATAALYGLAVAPSDELPLKRPAIWTRPSPLPRHPDAPVRPNAVVIFAESLSSVLLGAYDGGWPGLTPHLDRIAADCTLVRGWHNHVTPTVTGLRGQLCSSYPAMTYSPWRNAAVMPRGSRTLCLPHVLAADGWRTLYMSHSKPDETWIRAQAHQWGFAKTVMHDEVTERWLPGETPLRDGWGVSDQQMMRALAAFLRSPEAAGPQPFFVGVSTIETHLGVDAGSDWQHYPGKNDVTLHAVHNLDAAIGVAYDAWRTSPRARDTLFIVTADHALYPSPAIRALAKRPVEHRCDEVALLICDPTHDWPKQLDADTSSIGFAPTMAQLMGVTNQPVPWLGHSILADRAAIGGAVALIYSSDLTTIDGKTVRHGGEAEADRAALVEVVRYTQGLARLDRVWR